VTEREIMNAAIGRWGAQAQISKALEELGELISAVARQESAWQAALKDQDAAEAMKPDLLRNIYEEIADAEIMLRQLILIYGCETEVEVWREIKLRRLAERLGLDPETE